MMQIHAKSMTYSPQKKGDNFLLPSLMTPEVDPEMAVDGPWLDLGTSPGTFSVDLTELCQGFRAAERANMDDLRPESIYVA